MVKAIRKHFDEVKNSIKLRDVEEWFDIYFSRFFGLFFAKVARYIRLTPTHVSLVSLLVGVIGGAMLYYQDQLIIVGIGCLLIILAGVLDSADGQLARMTGQSTELGRVIDGLIDNFVFVAIYLGGCFYFVYNSDYGWWIFALAVASGWTQSLKAALYEFYKAEYLQLVGRPSDALIPLSADLIETQGSKWYHRILHTIHRDYTAKQLRNTTRSREWRAKAMELSKDQSIKEKFDAAYASLNMPLLTWWALVCGTNTHRTLAIVCVMFARFDIFMWASTIWTIGLIPLSLSQKRSDKKFLEILEEA